MEQEKTLVQENKMGVMNENKLLITMALPLIISMLVQACYNIVDSIFVAMVSEDALTAVSLAFPIQTIMIALGVGTGVGINATLSKSLGEKNYEKANKAAANGVFLALCSFAVSILIGLFVARPFYMVQVSENMQIVNDGVDYLRICCCLSLGVYIEITFERLMQGTGRTIYSMFTQLAGAITNIILDPLMIFGIGPFPEMGVAGAAVATVIGQWVAGILGILLNAKKNPDIQVHFKDIFHPNAKIIGYIYAVGIPSIIMSAIGSVMTFGMDLILVNFTTTAVAVFGAYFKLQSFFFMPILGMNNALVPIIAYNYGARKKDRVIKTIKLGIRYAMCFMLVGMLLFETIPGVLLGMFSPSEDMLAIGIPALRKIAIHFPIAAVCIILMSTLQALGKAFYSMLVAIGRQLVVLLPAAYILAKVGGLYAVWWSFPIAEAVSLALCTSFFLHVKRTIIDPLDHPVTADLQEVADRESVQC